MAVHAESRIPLWLNDYWPELYTSITDKEEWSYENQVLTSARIVFSNLAAALNAYKNTDISETFHNLVTGLHSYYSMTNVYDFGNDIDYSQYEYKKIFSIDTWGNSTISRPTDYYNDLAAFSSAKMTADITVINNAITSDTNKAKTLLRPMLKSFQKNVFKFCFEEYTGTPNAVSKREIGEFIYNDLGYKKINQSLNVAPFEPPSYIDY